jgi:hypothetical protein
MHLRMYCTALTQHRAWFSRPQMLSKYSHLTLYFRSTYLAMSSMDGRMDGMDALGVDEDRGEDKELV